jgi:choice-of-anchor A domain-containing protein
LVLGNFEGTSDTEGRLFVCGDATLRDYSVSSKLKRDHHRDDLVVGGNLNFHVGRVVSGNIVYGGDAQIGRPVAEGIIAHNFTIRQEPHRYDCDNAEMYFKTMSFELGNLRPSGETSLSKDGTLEFIRASASNPEVFDFDCKNIDKVRRIQFAGVEESGTVVINMRGSSCALTSFIIKPVTSSKLLFNFPEASEIKINAVSLDGNFVAPFAHVEGHGGVIVGQSVFGSMKGSTQQNMVHCDACVTGESSDLSLDVGF